jgi:hypothetical protein
MQSVANEALKRADAAIDGAVASGIGRHGIEGVVCNDAVAWNVISNVSWSTLWAATRR